MSSNTLCATCRQVFRLQFRQFGRPQEFSGALTTAAARNLPRLFSTSRLLSASPAAPRKPQVTPKKEPQATPRASQPKPAPVNAEDPKAVPSEGDEFRASSADTPTRSLAKEFTKRLPETLTEPYKAYGACQRLIKECARQADYTIPQAHEKNVEVPQTKDQEDLGVGTGWWFESERISLPYDHIHLTMPTDISFSRSWTYPDLQYLGPDNLPPHVPAYLPAPLLPSCQRNSMAPAPPRPILLRRRRPHGRHPQHRRALHPQQIPQGPLRAMARAAGGLRRGDRQGRRGAGYGGVAERVQGG